MPSNLRKQRNQELLDKFFLSSLILETPSFNQEIKKGNLNPFNQHEIIICSYHFARAKDAYIRNINWDLVVIDEAHRLRNVYKPQNKIANAVKNAVAHAPKILLTATPLQKSREIYHNWLEKYKDTDTITDSKTANLRAAIVDYFKDEAVIMIATEAAAEGINLQFCSFVVNYDLPWNPQRIEQRIGRCHRYGQKFDVVVVNFLNKSNAADQRVYQILDEKFRFFSGVFGASDEVLGSIESGVDFEKRIAQIYQNCRTPEEIQSSFDQLQKELEEHIEDRLKTARQKLLENFDEEVHEKLKVSLRESKEYLTRYENWLWQITKYYLEPYADFVADEYSFTLRENPFTELLKKVQNWILSNAKGYFHFPH